MINLNELKQRKEEVVAKEEYILNQLRILENNKDKLTTELLLLRGSKRELDNLTFISTQRLNDEDGGENVKNDTECEHI